MGDLLWKKIIDIYPLPFIVHSSYKASMHVLFLFFIFMFLGFMAIPINGLEGILYKLLCLASSLIFAYCWIFVGVLKKAYVELTEDGLLLRNAFIHKKLKWNDIVDVQTYCMNNNSFIGIISKEKLKKRKDNFFTFISSQYGGKYALSIPLRIFPTVEPEKLYSTLFYTVQKKYQQNYSDVENIEYISENSNEEKVVDSRPIKALFRALIMSVIAGIIYGLSIYYLKNNLVVIPFFGTVGIEYIYYKTYHKNHINILIRIYLGVLCALQVFIALLVAVLIENQKFIKMIGMQKAVYDFTQYIIKHPESYGIFYIFGIIFFFLGAFSGYSSKITRRIRKIFMKKQNGYYIKREKRYVSIYLIDYPDYNENEEKSGLIIDPDTCLIEKEKKKILAFYIPVEMLDNNFIDVKSFERISFKEKDYYKLNLGGHAEPNHYGYTGVLIFNKHRQAELIQLETD